MRALGASERVMDIIASAEVPTAAPTDAADAAVSANLEIAGGKSLARRVAGLSLIHI